MRLREIQNELVSHLLLLGQLGGGVGRLDAVVHVATVGFAVLLRILRNVLCVGDMHLRLQGQAFLRDALIIALCVCVKSLKHQRRLLQFLQFVLMVRLRGKAFEADVVCMVIFPFWHIGHFQVFLGNAERVSAGPDCQVQVVLGAADAGKHHGGGLEVDGVQHALLALGALLGLLEQQLADVGVRI